MSIVSRSTQQFSGFDPRSIPGCQLWLDAADSTTITTSGASVTAVRDKAQGISLSVQGSAASLTVVPASIGSMPSLYFNNTTADNVNLYTNSFSQPSTFSIFVVWRNLTQRAGSYRNIVYWEFNGTKPNPGGFVFGYQNVNALALWDSANGSFSSTVSVANDVPYVGYTQFGSPGIGLNGNTPTSLGVNTTAGAPNLYIGGWAAIGQSVSMYLGELIIYNNLVTTAQRQQIEGYLAWKWNLQSYYTPQFALPTTIPGCQLWLDAADSSTMSFSSGSNISQWRDKSGNGRHASSSSGTVTSTASTILFPANSSLSLGTIPYTSTQRSIFTVVTMTTSTAISVNHQIIGGNTLTVSMGLYTYGNLLQFTRQGNVLLESSATSVLGVRSMISATNSTGNLGIFVNGTSQTITLNQTGSFAFVSGSGNQTLGPGTQEMSISELILFDSAITTAQRQQIEGYLAWKWGLPNSFPAGHPWRLRNLPVSHPSFTIPPTLRSFQPTDIDGCQLWLDAADASVISFSSGSNVSQWRDKSGNGRNMAPPATINAPTFTGDRLLFDGVDDRLVTTVPISSLITAAQYTIFLYGNPISSSSAFSAGYTNPAFFGDTEGYMGLYVMNTGVVGVYNWNGGFQLAPQSYTLNTNGIFTAQHVSNTISLRVNGGIAVSTTSGNTDVVSGLFQLGRQWIRNEHLNCSIGEVIIFNTALTDSQRQQIEGYLAAKWGLSTALPPAIQAVPSVFDPRTISGCSLWLDAADSSTISFSSGSSISQWRDKTVNANNAILTANRPTYVATNRFVETSNLNQAFTVPSTVLNTVGGSLFIVYADKQENTANGMLFACANDFSPFFFNQGVFRSDGFSYALGSTDTPSTEFKNTMNTKQPLLYSTSYIHNSPSITVSLNGTVFPFTNNARPVAPAGPLVFSGGWGGGTNNRFYEIIFFNSILTTAQRQQVEGYLYAKWNVPVTRHPYYRMLALPSTPLFVPSQLSGLQLWLDGADPSTMTIINTNQVTQWNDKSGVSGRNVTSRLSTHPTYDSERRALRFFASSRFRGSYSINSSSITFLMVLNVASSNNGRFLSFSAANNDWDRVDSATFTHSSGYNTFRAGSRVGDLYTMALNTRFVLSGRFNGSTFQPRLNGTILGNPTSTGTFTFFEMNIGGHELGLFDGDIHEVIVFNTALTDYQMQLYEGYLAHKWGVQNSIPATHPYRKFRA